MRKKSLFIALIWMATCFQLTAQTVTWNGDGDNINWTDADNWDTDTVPVTGNDVVISGSSSVVTLTGTHTVRMVTISSSADLTISSGAILNIDGATLDHGLETTGSGNVIINNGTINITGITTANRDGIYSKGTFTNNGTIDIDGVTGSNGDGIYVAVGTFTNSSGATITINNVGADSIRTDDNSGTPAIFSNEGTITITQTTGDDGIYVNDSSTFNNTGIITVSGTGGDCGIMIDDGGTFNNNSGGTFTVNATINDQIFIDNTGIVTNTGTINLNNSGDLGLYVTDQGVFTNNTGGNVTITDATDDSIQINNSTANISNSGTITTQNGSLDGLDLLGGGIFTNNSGGNLVINQPTGEGIRLNASGGTLTNSGTITITGSGSGVAPGDNGIEVSGGTLTNATGATLTLTNIFDDGIYINNGTINNTGTINVSNTGEEGLFMSTDSSFTNNSGGSLVVNQPTSEGITASSGTITNSGTISVTGSGSGVAPGDNGINVTGGTLTNASGATLTITNIFDDGLYITSGIINNTGTIDISNTGEEGYEIDGGTFNNNNGGILKANDCVTDNIQIDAGALINDGHMELNRTTDGSGRDDIEFNGGTFTNNSNATFNPGTVGGYGENEIRGNIDLGSATVTFDISGTTHTSEFDRIEVVNVATLTITGATMHLNWGSYVPNVGDTFKVIDGSTSSPGAVSGPFSAITTSNSDIVISVDYSGTTEVEIEVTDINSTWTGGTDNDWSKVGNWSTLPNSSTDVTIPSGLSNYPTVTTAETISSLTIASGATLVATNAGFTVSNNASYTRSLASGSQWYLMSSPVNVENFNNDWVTTNSIPSSTQDTDNRGISWYNNSSSDTDSDGAGTTDSATGFWRYMAAGDDTPFAVGAGYGVIRSSAGNIEFIGSGIYTSDQTRLLQTGVNNFNLVGNPFNGFITLGTFHSTNSAVIGTTLYTWNGSSYTSRVSNVVDSDNQNFEIAPGQGFFVEASSASNVTFSISDVSHQGTDTFQKNSNVIPTIKLYLNSINDSRFAKIYYVDGTTKGYDNGYDGKLFGGVSHSFSIYSGLVEGDGNKYQLQSLPNSNHENMIIPVGVIAKAGNEITFSAEALNLPNGINVYLEDRIENIYTRLDEANATYKVTLDESIDGVGRFYLHTSAKSALNIDDNISLDNLSIFKANSSTLRIIGLKQGKTSISLYNILGKQMMQTSFDANGVKDISLPKLATGVYFAEVQTETGKVSKKIILE